jgi:hypothetical protein
VLGCRRDRQRGATDHYHGAAVIFLRNCMTGDPFREASGQADRIG